MKTELHPANDRGHANHGWLNTYHCFSFADYFNPLREQFGALRVLNDDIILGGEGFGEHPHNNMEIISIPLSGKLEHRDSMGHVEVIGPGEVQVMSAGTGIRHSEYNHSQDKDCNFLQLWIYTRNKGIIPRYNQKVFDLKKRENAIQTLVTPDSQPEEDALWIYQDAWISVTRLKAGKTIEYTLHNFSNGVFAFVIEGESTVAGQKLGKRDAVAIRESLSVGMKAQTESEILLVEIPMDKI